MMRRKAAGPRHLSSRDLTEDESWMSRLRGIAVTYGPLAIGFHLSVEAVVFGGFYTALGQGLDVTALLDKVEDFTGFQIPISPTASRAIAALGLTTSLTGFPRTVLTVLATPWLARRLGWNPKKKP